MKKIIWGFLFSLFLLSPSNVASANQAELDKAIQYSRDAYIVQSSAIFEYVDGAQYQISTKVGYVTDIALGAGEEITYIGGGETVRWVFDTAKVGNTNHVYVRPIKEGIDTNLIINTTKRTYRVLLVSTNWYNPLISWSFPLEITQKELQKNNFEKDLYIERNDQPTLETLDFNYKWKGKGSSPGFLPEQVFDDGQKTYIRLPKTVSTSNYPVLYITEKNNKASLVNFRVKDNYIILDRVFEKAQLVVNKEIVEIKRTAKRG